MKQKGQGHMKCQIVRARQSKHMPNPLCNQVGLYENIWDEFNIGNSQVINHNTNCHRLKKRDILICTPTKWSWYIRFKRAVTAMS